MLKGKTQSGFDFVIDEAVMDDMELLEDIVKADKDTMLFPDILEKILGADQKAALYDHLRKNGRVSIKETVEAFTEIMNIAGEETKNS